MLNDFFPPLNIEFPLLIAGDGLQPGNEKEELRI